MTFSCDRFVPTIEGAKQRIDDAIDAFVRIKNGLNCRYEPATADSSVNLICSGQDFVNFVGRPGVIDSNEKWGATMLTGTVRAMAEVIGTRRVSPATFELPFAESGATQVTVDFLDDSKVQFTVSFAQIDSPDIADSIAKVLFDRAVDRIAFVLALAVGNPTDFEHSLHPIETESSSIYVATLGDQLRMGEDHSVIQYSKVTDSQRSDLQSQSLSGESSFPLFRTILKSQDCVEQYICLYALLDSLIPGNQEQNNVFIRRIDADIEQRFSPYHDKDEPIYTWLRNELMHFQRTPGITIEIIQKEMKSNLAGLRNVVKAAISHKGTSASKTE